MTEGFGTDQERLAKREANPLLRLVNEDGVWKYVPMAVGFGKDQERLTKREASPLYTLVNENGLWKYVEMQMVSNDSPTSLATSLADQESH